VQKTGAPLHHADVYDVRRMLAILLEKLRESADRA
jgi:hypothetical protein